MNNVIGTIYNSNQFSHAKDHKLFVSEISLMPQVLRQLWNDAMDLGFGICSAKTGKVIYFTLLDVERDSDGDVIRWVFEPFRPPEALKGYRVHIYNT